MDSFWNTEHLKFWCCPEQKSHTYVDDTNTAYDDLGGTNLDAGGF